MSVSTPLVAVERPANGPADGLVVLHHGRGSNEHDLISLADVLDPERRLHFVTPRAPLQFTGMPGNHWYVVPRVGYPDPKSFHAGYLTLAGFHDSLWDLTGIGPERTVLGGFSQGTVMSYALGLGPDRPSVAGILAFSGFIPTVEGWHPDVATHRDTRVFLAHGRRDPVIGVDFARQADQRLTEAGLEHEYHESNAPHQIDASQLPAAIGWLQATLGRVSERPTAA